MGIAGFQKWLLANFPRAATVQSARVAEVYDYICFDMNQVLHTSARIAPDRPALAARVFRELDSVLKTCVPRRGILFAFDGPGPWAKVVTQRKRRGKEKSAGGGKRRRVGIGRGGLTPGCELMDFLEGAVEYWAYSRLQNDRKFANVDICISGPRVSGEGELKVIDMCSFLRPGNSVCVIGGDADIVLQGLACVGVRNFFVFLKGERAKKGKPKKGHVVISVWELARTFESLFPGESSAVRLDFIVLCMLNGNDYVPKVRGVTMPRLWRRYCRLKSVAGPDGSAPPFKGQTLVDPSARTFNWPFFHALITKVGVPVSEISESLLRESKINSAAGLAAAVAKSASEYGDSDSDEGDDCVVYTGNEDGVLMADLEDEEEDEEEEEEEEDEDDEEDGEDDGFESEPEDFDDIDEDKTHIDNLVAISGGNSSKYFDTERWFRTLLWTLHMYVDGYCSDYSFEYGKPYGPSCDAITNYIMEHDGTPFTVCAPVSNAPSLLPHQAAMALLPASSKQLLPMPLQKIVDDPVLAQKIFLPGERVDLGAMLFAIDAIPIQMYSPDEARRTIFGAPFVVRRPRHGDRVPRTNPIIRRPGPRYQAIRPAPAMVRAPFRVTTTPPCYPWPRGSFPNMLQLPHQRVRGSPMRAPPKPAEHPAPAPPGAKPAAGASQKKAASASQNGNPASPPAVSKDGAAEAASRSNAKSRSRGRRSGARHRSSRTAGGSGSAKLDSGPAASGHGAAQ